MKLKRIPNELQSEINVIKNYFRRLGQDVSDSQALKMIANNSRTRRKRW